MHRVLGNRHLEKYLTGIGSVRDTSLHPFVQVCPWDDQMPIPPISEVLPFLLHHVHLVGGNAVRAYT